jgi:DNA-binding SARP family transcriptional activator
MLEIRVLGGLEVRADGAPVELPPAARVRSLLAFLAVHPGRHPRSLLAGRLRPDALEESARKSLRQAAWSLRGALGAAGEGLVAGRETLGLAADPALVRVDLAEYRALVAADRLEEAVALARGDLLAGLDEEWAHGPREEHRAQVVALLGELAERAEAAGDLAGAIDWSRRRAAADPLAEIPARELIGRLARAGDRAGAVAAYDALRERLRRDLGIAPSAETRELVEQVRRGRPAAGAARAPSTHPPLPPPLARDDPFVGRERELTRLEAAWRDARAGALRLACLSGEPGIGKTRLAGRLAARVHAEGALVLYGRCDEETLVPHQPFVEALERLLRALPAEEREGLLGPHRAELSRLLPALDPGGAPVGEAEGESGRYRAFEAARALVEGAAARRPALLVLDDLHWADRPTLLLLRHLGRMVERAPVLVLGTYRDTDVDRAHPLATTLADLRREHPVVTIPLAGLSEPEVADLLGEAPGAGEGLVAALRARTSGNPFFLTELARDLREEGSARAPGLPPGVKEVVGRRLDRLGQDAVEVLTTAALAGPDVDLALLEELHGPEPALSAIERAGAAGLLIEADPARTRHAFAHALVAETLQEGVSAARSARLHRRIADALEPRAVADPAAHAADVARHLLAAGPAGDPERAVRWSVAAAERATALLADDEAAAHYARALGVLAVGDDRRGELLAALGDARNRAGGRGAAREAFLEAAALARARGDARLLARAALGAGGIGVTIGPADAELVRLLEEALAALAAEPALRARLLGRLAAELYYADRPRADALSREAVAAARASGDDSALAAALNARRVAIWDMDHVRERLAVATEMVEVAERAGDREVALQGRNWRVLDLLELGRIDEVVREIDAYSREADALGLPHYRWYVPLWRAALAQMAGDDDEARRLGAEARVLGDRAEDPNTDLFLRLQEEQILVDRGRFDETDRDWVLQGVATSAAPWAWLSWLAWVDAMTGRPDAARAIVDDLAAGGFAAVTLDANWHAVMDLCEAVVELGDRPRAERLLQMLAPYSGLVAAVARAAVCYGPLDYALGRLAAAIGDAERAEAYFASAAADSERLGAAPRAAQSRARLAQARAALRR